MQPPPLPPQPNKRFVILLVLIGCFVPSIISATMVSANDKSQIIFYLYTLANPGAPQQIYVDDKDTLQASNFSPKRLTKVLIHGWNADYTTISVRTLKHAYLAAGDYNVFLVNWKPLANQDYITSRSVVRRVGLYVARFMDFLVYGGEAKPADMHLLGHSLGAHIAGNTARGMTNNISRVTGLDPALPLFSKDDNDILTSKDAVFVDVIHTDGGQLGMFSPLGQVDFYPNGGKPSQPGCMIIDIVSIGTCSHMRAPYYFGETIMNPNSMLGIQCDNMENFMAGKCNENPSVPMGESCPPGTTGTYFFQTRSLAPYGMGNIKMPFEKLD